MANDSENIEDPKSKGFPFITALATLISLFVFLGLVVLAYQSPNYLGDKKIEPSIDPGTKLNDLRSKNQAVLDGTPGSGTRMPVSEANSKLLSSLKSEKDVLPFPMPEPPAPPVPEPRKK